MILQLSAKSSQLTQKSPHQNLDKKLAYSGFQIRIRLGLDWIYLKTDVDKYQTTTCTSAYS